MDGAVRSARGLGHLEGRWALLGHRDGDPPPSIRIGASPLGDEWLVSVEDAGIGVDPRHADRIFVVFQRLQVGDESGGTGIGLAMAKKIVEFHGGRIWLDTDHRPGTRISFTLPTADRRAARPPKQEVAGS